MHRTTGRSRRAAALVLVAAIAAGAFFGSAPGPVQANSDATSLAYVNGQLLRVRFSDGDTFRMQGGPFPNANARLAGFNTLESYGPVHRWGSWHPYELFVNAKQATLNARRGIWHCFGDGERDGYGRVLLDCPDLAVDQIRKGFAHAMNIDDTPAPAPYIRAQQEAIRERRGMWAHGVPEFIMTSLHSIDEYPELSSAMNRMVSTRDGHSERLHHEETYGECEWVCAIEVRADREAVRAVAQELRAHPDLAPRLAEHSNLLVIEVVDRFARMDTVPAWIEGVDRDLVEAYLREAKAAGRLGELTEEAGSCNLYVPFERRYDRERPQCLRGHGDDH